MFKSRVDKNILKPHYFLVCIIESPSILNRDCSILRNFVSSEIRLPSMKEHSVPILFMNHVTLYGKAFTNNDVEEKVLLITWKSPHVGVQSTHMGF